MPYTMRENNMRIRRIRRCLVALKEDFRAMHDGDICTLTWDQRVAIDNERLGVEKLLAIFQETEDTRS